MLSDIRPAGDFAQARVAAEEAQVVQQRQAARRVAEHSRDAGDCRELLLMLGLMNTRQAADEAHSTNAGREQHTNLPFPDALAAFRPTEGARR